jgi:hypothetical protein
MGRSPCPERTRNNCRVATFLLASGTFSALIRLRPQVTFTDVPSAWPAVGALQFGHPRQVNTNGGVEATSRRDRRSLGGEHGLVNRVQAILATDSEWVGITSHSLSPRLALLRKREDNLPKNVNKSI